ncbi:hypothetical protein LCGC14_2551870, partial [marine sediment metagenome]
MNDADVLNEIYDLRSEIKRVGQTLRGKTTRGESTVSEARFLKDARASLTALLNG